MLLRLRIESLMLVVERERLSSVGMIRCPPEFFVSERFLLLVESGLPLDDRRLRTTRLRMLSMSFEHHCNLLELS